MRIAAICCENHYDCFEFTLILIDVLRRDIEKIGVGVTVEAQMIFDAISKT